MGGEAMTDIKEAIGTAVFEYVNQHQAASPGMPIDPRTVGAVALQAILTSAWPEEFHESGSPDLVLAMMNQDPKVELPKKKIEGPPGSQNNPFALSPGETLRYISLMMGSVKSLAKEAGFDQSAAFSLIEISEKTLSEQTDAFHAHEMKESERYGNR
jgi:hypothetical protein